MIERLWSPELLGRDKEYQRILLDLVTLEKQLSQSLNESQNALLSQISDAYAQRENYVTQKAFVDGFAAAVEVYTDFVKRCKRPPS